LGRSRLSGRSASRPVTGGARSDCGCFVNSWLRDFALTALILGGIALLGAVISGDRHHSWEMAQRVSDALRGAGIGVMIGAVFATLQLANRKRDNLITALLWIVSAGAVLGSIFLVPGP
jgi:hypothetical protein